VKVWVFVEGPADKLGLEALWTKWRVRLKAAGWGLVIVPLQSKANFLRKFGTRAAEKLAHDGQDLVVGLPDLYPTAPFNDSEFRHPDVGSLKELQRRTVEKALRDHHGVAGTRVEDCIQRLRPSVFRHDFEMLLLAAVDALRDHLGTSERLGHWRVPVEDQDLVRPPKRLIETLFLTKSRRRKAYRDTKDAPAILSKVTDLRAILLAKGGQWTCPEFVALLQWLGDRTQVPICDLS
jgi:hypothetical protein